MFEFGVESSIFWVAKDLIDIILRLEGIEV